MKRLAVVLWAAACAVPGIVRATPRAAPSAAPPPLPAVFLDYRIEAALDPATREVKGRETIRWRNPAERPVATLPLHVYVNAFAHEDTTWMRHQLGRDAGDPEKIWNDPWGWTVLDAVREVRGAAHTDATWQWIRPDDGNLNDRTLAEIALAAPAAPGAEVVLEILWTTRLPVPFARMGWTPDFVLLGQWYPKLGVIEPAGVRGAPAARSAARQFHGKTEFYADFADYEVTLDAPQDWIVGATGREIGAAAPRPKGVLRHVFRQRAVHDFALVAGSHLARFVERHATAGGGPAVEVTYLLPRGTEHQLPRWSRATYGAIDVMARRVGPYPYDTLTVVIPPHRASRTAGMEYPTFLTGEPGDPALDRWPLAEARFAEDAIVHEFCHQVFYGLIASNEQDESYLDEGNTHYWDHVVLDETYGARGSLGSLLGHEMSIVDGDAGAVAQELDKHDEPLAQRPSFLYRWYWSESYMRPALTLYAAHRRFGREAVDRGFREYYRRWAFRHPQLADFLDAMRAGGGDALGDFLQEAYTARRIPHFAVRTLRTGRWSAPAGHLFDDHRKSGTTAGPDPTRGLDPAARETDGRVLVEITDPGFVRGLDVTEGGVRRELRKPETGPVPGPPRPKNDDGKDRFYETTVTLDGPGWDHLPADVVFRFADGSIVRDAWDGRATWRTYRFVRPVPLWSVQLDPEEKNAIDPDPSTHGLLAAPRARVRTGWAAWMSAAAQWLAAGAAQWF